MKRLMVSRSASRPEPPRIRRAALLLAALSLLAPGRAAVAACKMPGERIGPAVLAGYLNHPDSILIEHPLADTGLTILTTQLATASTDALTALMGAVSSASDKQRQAIGAGLAVAANTCMRQDSTIVQRIKNAVKKSGSSSLQRTFAINYDVGPSGNAAASSVDSSLKSGPELPKDLTLPRLSGTGKLPDPFGPPDGWH